MGKRNDGILCPCEYLSQVRGTIRSLTSYFGSAIMDMLCAVEHRSLVLLESPSSQPVLDCMEPLSTPDRTDLNEIRVGRDSPVERAWKRLGYAGSAVASVVAS